MFNNSVTSVIIRYALNCFILYAKSFKVSVFEEWTPFKIILFDEEELVQVHQRCDIQNHFNITKKYDSTRLKCILKEYDKETCNILLQVLIRMTCFAKIELQNYIAEYKIMRIF